MEGMPDESRRIMWLTRSLVLLVASFAMLSYSSAAAATLLVLAVGCAVAFVRGSARKRSKVVLALAVGFGVAWIGFLVLFFAMAPEL